MAKVLFEAARNGLTFCVILTGDGHHLIQESRGDLRKSYRINGTILAEIRAAADPFAAAEDAYHPARLKKARRRAKGAGAGGR